MNLKYLISFIAGAAIGGSAVYILEERKIQKIVNEELSMIAVVPNDEDNTPTDTIADDKEETNDITPFNPTTQTPVEKLNYDKVIKESGYSETETEETPKKKGGKKSTKNKYAHITYISPDDISEESWSIEYLTMYTDGVLVHDVDDEVEEKPDDLIGPDWEKHLGEHVDRMLYVKNSKTELYYEVAYIDAVFK